MIWGGGEGGGKEGVRGEEDSGWRRASPQMGSDMDLYQKSFYNTKPADLRYQIWWLDVTEDLQEVCRSIKSSV
jgi:hypothetical protein